MPSPATAQEPVRATLLAILKLLNQADTLHEGERAEQSLELLDLERRLSDFWAVDQGSVKVSLALGLLLRNGLVEPYAGADGAWVKPPTSKPRYGITAEGKRFLVDSLENQDRIPGSRPRS